ncbi:Leucine-binding protein domain containing protein [Acidimicrobiia bacterium]
MASRRPTRTRRGAVLAVAVVAAISLFAGACGGGRSDSTTDTTAKGGASSTSFGDLESPCGKGTPSGPTSQGVSADSVTIGYGDDAGYSGAPGLNKEMSDAIKAMIAWCNEQGGINGRKVVGNYYDAAIMNVNNVMTEACSQVFMLVGQGWSLDSAQEQTRLGCALPSVPTYTVSPAFANGKLMYQPLPNPVDKIPLEFGYAMAEKFPTQVKKAAVMTANYAATKDSTDKAKLALPAAGWTFLDCEQTYSIGGEADWKPFLTRLKDCGAEVVFFSGSPAPNFQNVLDAAKQLNYSPIWMTDANFYDTTFAKWNTSGNADNVYVSIGFTMFEQASTNPATQKYLDLLAKANGKTGLLGAQATSAFLLWASAAQECGATLTRECVMSKLAGINEWTGGGLHSPADPGGNNPRTCGIVVKMKGTTYEQFYPAKMGEFDCSPKFVATITGPLVTAANLDANRISQPK